MHTLLFALLTLSGLIFSLPGPVLAADAASTSASPAVTAPMSYEIGQNTRAWLDLQRSGQAAGLSHSLPAEAASPSYQRYLKSFTHPIPEFYRPPQEFLSGGGTGGGRSRR